MNYVSTVSYEVLLNGSPLEVFKPTYGLRQGDPLSPYLFILCMEVLSGKVIQAQNAGALRGIRLCPNVPPLTHLFFADDVVFFLQDSNKSIYSLKSILDAYCRASGQRINDNKFGVLFSPSTKLNQARECLQVLNIRHNAGIGKYLGLPTKFNGSKREIFAGLIEMVSKRVSSWNGIFLSPAGRLTLISSVLSNIYNYFLSVFKLPVKDLRLIDGSWDTGFLRFLFTPELVNKILAIPCCLSQVRDKVFWKHTSDGLYSVKSGYGIAFEEYMKIHGTTTDRDRINEAGVSFYKKILWNLPWPSSWKVFLWRLLTNSLPMGAEFMRRNIQVDSSCKLCVDCEGLAETSAHLFRDCRIACRVWACSDLGIRTLGSAHINIGDWVINWIIYLRKTEDAEIKVIKFLATLWCLWLVRNRILFQGEHFHPQMFFWFVVMLGGDGVEGA
ncbi:uncharacterized protein LOC141629235 [Silene latifolia]|uniref:uncharacterized protein LOC141629235 n=1 Tax=Silene latifolia TaxID=37657 RepID=UPI003D7734F9